MENRLRELRKEKGFTQVKMQHLTGIDQSDYSKIESGKRYFTFEQCKRIAQALGASMDYLAGLTDEKKAYPPAAQKDYTGNASPKNRRTEEESSLSLFKNTKVEKIYV